MATIRPDENCPYCGLPDEADREMVQCDQCDVWYHFRCAGVTRAVKHQPWFCGPCQSGRNRHNGPNREDDPAASEEDNYSVPPSELSSLRSHTSSSIRQGLQLLDEQFQVRQKRLAEEKALQERRLALEEEYAKQQNDLREEHLKVRQELLSSLRDMSVGGSRGSAHSQASAVRSERVRQWMDKQQNPVENPRKVDPRGAFPNNKSAKDVSPLRNPNLPQHLERANKSNDSVRAGRPHEFPSDEPRGDVGYEGVPDGLGRRNVHANREQNALRPCPAPRQHMPSTIAQETRRPCPAPRNVVDGLGQRKMPSTSARDAPQPHLFSSFFAEHRVPGTGRIEDVVSFRGQPGEGEAGQHRPLISRGNDGRAARNSFEDPPASHADGDLALFTGAPYQQLQPQPPPPVDAGDGRSHFKTPQALPQAHLRYNQSGQREGNDHGLQDRGQFGGITPEQLASRQVLPRKLPIFSGSYEEWPLFISCYNTTTEACGYTNNENLVRLLDCLRDPALGHVRGQLLLPQSVPRVIETLRRIYGRPEQLLQSLLMKARRCDPPKSDRLETFITFSLVIEQLCDHLEATNLQDHLVNPMLLQELVDKTPAGTKLEWVRFKRRHGQVTLRTFADFMAGIAEDACEVAPMVDNKQLAGDKRVEKRTKERGFVHAHDATTVPGQITKERVDIKPCRVCQSTEHKIRNCDEFKNLTQADKTALVVKWKICRICLNEHGDSRCRFKIQCNVEQCRERHHPLMHGEAATTHAAEATEVTHNAHRADIGQMQFRLVAVTLHHGTRSVRTTAFLDEGSSMSLVERSLVDVLGVKGGELEPLRLIWTADISRTEKNSKKISVQISTAGCDQKHQLALRTVTELKLPTPSFKISSLTKQFKHLGDLEVDDNLGKPRLLLGLDNLHLFAPQESRIGQPNEPIAVKSKLGWSVYGPSSDNKCGGGVVGTHFTENISNQELHDLIKEYFAVEEAGVTAGVLESDDDRRARVILENTTVKVGGRYETGLLWRSDDYDFPNSYPMAVRRLEQLEKKLSKNPELAENVRRQITEYQLKEYAHKATPKELSDSEPRKVWYIPLSVVVNPRKSKVRLVWDAAASVNGVSLNSQLLKGPDLLVSLIEVLCRFRERPVAFGGDLQEMYHQVRIRSEDKQAQRFLFRDNPTLKPDVYVMDVATFGATSSPASAQFVKNKNAAEFAHVHPEAAAAIIQRHYVDDYFDSADTEEEAIERAQAVKHIHAQGGFHIRNWVSNSSRFLEALGEPNQKQNVQFTSDKHTNTERILGITWNPVLDVFVFSIPTNEALQPFMTGKARPTKSIVLKFLMSFFDPLGLIAHYLVHGKILMQDIWRSGCDWKATINDDCYAGWTQWIKWLPLLEQLQIPRSYFGDIRSSKIESVELHVFSDASEKAYGSGAYLRIVCDGAIRCTLALAKTKVAPLKLLSIPRLEVSGAVLGARLANTAETCHSLPISRRVFWVDSATVIAWIHSDHRKYKPFVAHRISEILSLTSVDEWHFVSTKSNVADDLTKWRKRFTMSCEDRSIRGPDFIYTDSKSWSVPATPIESVEEELRAAFLFHEIHLPEPVIDAERFSSWKTLVRSLAVIFRFRSNCQRKARGLPIEAVPATPAVTGHVKGAVSSTEVPLRQEEYVQAENCFWRLVQADMFPDEVKVLLKNRELPREEWHQVEKTSVIYQLSPFLDHAGVLRMEGRTEAAEELPFDLRFPVILPKKHPITIKLVEHYHRKLRHGNNETVVNEMRQRFFIGNLRAVVRMVANDCQLCKIRQSRPAVPRMAPLPVQRLQPYLRPFSFVGVDYCGPFTVTVGRRSEKRWIAVFTCFNTRAVHLEVAHSLNKQSCLMALRRFMCRYGVPREIFSDNGTNFHGANNEGVLIRAINNNCADVVTDARLKWNFNPPSAPHMGGVWERMVRSVKECLKVLDDGRKLTDEVLLTVLAEAAEIINSRPLTYQPQDASSPEALTPNHFLRVGPANEELVLGAANEGQALTDSYQRSQMLAQQMWKRWISEYVPSLNRRSKWHEEREPVKAGDLVFIADEEQRKTWIRGIVDEVIKAKDGRVRQAVVRAQGKLYKRPVAKLAVIEVGANGRSEPHSEKPRD